MFADRMKGDIAQFDRFAVIAGILERAFEQGDGIFAIAAEPFPVGADDPRRRSASCTVGASARESVTDSSASAFIGMLLLRQSRVWMRSAQKGSPDCPVRDD
jgi:hypothetical protein